MYLSAIKVVHKIPRYDLNGLLMGINGDKWGLMGRKWGLMGISGIQYVGKVFLSSIFLKLMGISGD